MGLWIGEAGRVTGRALPLTPALTHRAGHVVLELGQLGAGRLPRLGERADLVGVHVLGDHGLERRVVHVLVQHAGGDRRDPLLRAGDRGRATAARV